MLLQTVIRLFSYSLSFQSLLKTAPDCCRTERQIQRDARDSAHTARRSTIPAPELSAIDWEEAVATQFSKRDPLQISFWGAMHEVFLKASS